MSTDTTSTLERGIGFEALARAAQILDSLIYFIKYQSTTRPSILGACGLLFFLALYVSTAVSPANTGPIEWFIISLLACSLGWYFTYIFLVGFRACGDLPVSLKSTYGDISSSSGQQRLKKQLREQSDIISLLVEKTRVQVASIRDLLFIGENQSDYPELESVGVLVNLLDNHLYRLNGIICSPVISPEILQELLYIKPDREQAEIIGISQAIKVEEFEWIIVNLISQVQSKIPQSA